jgi:DNA-directed RNA polymerase subunit RPC12/RpoP
MPTYAFHCRDCDMSFERTMRVAEYERAYERRDGDGERIECPRCKSTRVMLEIASFEVQTPSKTL